jgi:hypothetical protein
MKYELEYGGCFDYMFFDVIPEQNIINFLRDEWNVEIVKQDIVEVELLKLLESWHERGVIQPERGIN